MASVVYSLFGLSVSSEVSLIELAESHLTGPPDVVVRFGNLPFQLDVQPGYTVTQWGTLLQIPNVARFLIRHGSEITIERYPSASERNVRLFLLGSAFGAILHQRGLLPLHANAIEVDGSVIAFSGHSGAGKSTIAAWFHDRGYPILSDDVCVVGFDGAGRPLAYPGIPRLRLWREALEASGRSTDALERSFDDMDKFNVSTLAEAQLEPRPLGAVYLLRKREVHSELPAIQRLAGVEALDTLVSNTYRGGYLKMIGGTVGHLKTCLRLAKAAPVFRAERTWGFDRFEEEARHLEAHARSVIGNEAGPPS